MKIFRKMNSIERKDLAEKFHISDDALYRIERGETGLSGEYAYILANEYNCDMNFIYGQIPASEFAAKSMESNIETIKASADRKNVIHMISRMLKFAAEILDGEK